MKSYMLLIAAFLAYSSGNLVGSMLVKSADKRTWGPLVCDTDNFKHDRFDGEAFDMEVQKERKTVTVETDEASGKHHLTINLDEDMMPRFFLGNWTCDDRSWIVVGDPFISRLGKPSDENKLRPSLAVMEEERVKLMCEVYYFGEESVSITWGMIAEETGEELNLTSKWDEEPVKEDHRVQSTLTLSTGVEMTDRANYTCTVSLNGKPVEPPVMRGILLRVKGKYAALWPFLGICAEVIILCVGIFIYERRTKARNDDAGEEEETPEAQVVAGDEKGDDVRKRTVKT